MHCSIVPRLASIKNFLVLCFIKLLFYSTFLGIYTSRETQGTCALRHSKSIMEVSRNVKEKKKAGYHKLHKNIFSPEIFRMQLT